MERSREHQFVHLLKRQSFTAEHLGIALASLSPHRIPFVHIVDPSEFETTVIEDCLLALARDDIAPDGLVFMMNKNLAPQIRKGKIEKAVADFVFSVFRKSSKHSRIPAWPCERYHKEGVETNILLFDPNFGTVCGWSESNNGCSERTENDRTRTFGRLVVRGISFSK